MDLNLTGKHIPGFSTSWASEQHELMRLMVIASAPNASDFDLMYAAKRIMNIAIGLSAEKVLIPIDHRICSILRPTLMANSIELVEVGWPKACPFCKSGDVGPLDVTRPTEGCEENYTEVTVVCFDCGAHGPHISVRDADLIGGSLAAIEKWNKN